MPFPVKPVMKLFMKPPEQGARTSVWCATSPDFEATRQGGYYTDCRPKEASKAATPELAAELWKRSEAWTA